MASERVSMLNILRANDGQMELWRLGQEMTTQKTLGFWVDIEDLVYSLKETEELNYNSKTGIVSLKIDHTRGLCGKPDVPNNTPQEAVEKNGAKCLCCGSKMEIRELGSLSMEQLGIYQLVCLLCP